MGALLLARLVHPLGMYAKPNAIQFLICRGGGIFVTIGLLIAAAVMILLRTG
jgi:hypothetical protein